MVPLNFFQKDKLQVKVHKDEKNTGNAAASFVADRIRSCFESKGKVNLMLATGASQFSFLNGFLDKDLDWKRITVFHLDEYVGISDKHPASFRKFLKERFTDIVKPGKTFFLNGNAKDLRQEMSAYEALLKQHPIDIACIGIGENGHIAFNDPAVADFRDPLWVKMVELDEDCRNQQVGEGWFPSFEAVPKKAITVSITAIMNCNTISCVVPGKRKIQAVDATLNNPVSTDCPASILRNHSDATLFLDIDAAAGLK